MPEVSSPVRAISADHGVAEEDVPVVQGASETAVGNGWWVVVQGVGVLYHGLSEIRV